MQRAAGAFLAMLLAVAVALGTGQPVVAAGHRPKVAIIVGPAGEVTARYRSLADDAAAVARRAGARVVTVYSPNATWPAVRAAISGASIVVYLGHGNGWPSRYRDELFPPSQNGFGLNPVAGADDSAHEYFGEASIDDVRLAKNAVVLLHHLCYASGNSEPGLPEGSRTDAIARVDNYAAGFIRAGAAAVVAEGHLGPAWYVQQLLTTNRTIERIWTRSPKTHGNVFSVRSTRSHGFSERLDPDQASGGYYRSLVSRGVTATDLRRTASGTPTSVPPAARVEPTLASGSLAFGEPGFAALPVAGTATTLVLPVAKGRSDAIPAGARVAVRWDPIIVDPRVEPAAEPVAEPATLPVPDGPSPAPDASTAPGGNEVGPAHGLFDPPAGSGVVTPVAAEPPTLALPDPGAPTTDTPQSSPEPQPTASDVPTADSSTRVAPARIAGTPASAPGAPAPLVAADPPAGFAPAIDPIIESPTADPVLPSPPPSPATPGAIRQDVADASAPSSDPAGATPAHGLFSISTEADAVPVTVLPDPPPVELVVPERLGSVVDPAPVTVDEAGLTAPINFPDAPGLYRLVTTLHAPTGVAYDAATQAMLTNLLVRVANRVAVAYGTPADLTMTADSEDRVPIRIVNTGSEDWGATFAWLRPSLVATWHGATESQAAVAQSVDLDASLATPGAEAATALRVRAPAEPGQYLLVIDVVSPTLGPLTALGSPPALIRVTVTPPEPGADGADGVSAPVAGPR